MPIAIIVPMLEIESILSNGVGPFMALTRPVSYTHLRAHET